MDNKKVIGIYGVFSVGKSFIAHDLSSKFLEYDTVATDNLLAIARDLDKSDPYLQQSSYLAWKVLGDNSSENIIEGFNKYRDKLQPFIRIILDRAYNQRVDMILEGIHISPEVFQEYGSLLDARPILITIPDRTIHWARIKEKCKDRPTLLERITPHFDTARKLQDYLIEEAKRCNVPIIENSGKKETTIDSIMEHLKW